MDYKKAYEEALGWMRSIYPTLTGAEKEDAEHYFPELKESEDERTRRELVDFILYKAGNLLDEDTEHRYITYLERAKDHFRDDTKKIEQEPLSTEETELNSIAFLEQLGYTCVPPRAEQKPAEWSEEDIKKIRSEEYTKGFNDAAFGGKLKEWSEEDEKMLEQAIKCVNNSGKLEVSTEEIEDWLISLPEKFNLQPKQEWSEEDEYKLNFLTEMLEGLDHREFDTRYMKELSSWLKSLRPQSHWKPSEEQMDALKAVYSVLKSHDTWCEDEHLPVLSSLMSDLQKLL